MNFLLYINTMTSPASRILGEISGNRRYNHEITPESKAAILVARAYGESSASVARLTGVSRRAQDHTLQRWATQRTLESSFRTGRPAILTERAKRTLKFHVRRDPRSTYKEIREALGINASDATLRRALQELNLPKWRAAKRIPLSVEDMKGRSEFCTTWLPELERLLRVSTSNLPLVRTPTLTHPPPLVYQL